MRRRDLLAGGVALLAGCRAPRRLPRRDHRVRRRSGGGEEGQRSVPGHRSHARALCVLPRSRGIVSCRRTRALRASHDRTARGGVHAEGPSAACGSTRRARPAPRCVAPDLACARRAHAAHPRHVRSRRHRQIAAEREALGADAPRALSFLPGLDDRLRRQISFSAARRRGWMDSRCAAVTGSASSSRAASPAVRTYARWRACDRRRCRRARTIALAPAPAAGERCRCRRGCCFRRTACPSRPPSRGDRRSPCRTRRAMRRPARGPPRYCATASSD